MSVVDIEKLLTEISPEDPAGPDLEYDPAYAAMARLAQGQPGQQIVETAAEVVEIDWRDLKRRCLELSARTRDLRLGVYLTRALLRTDGFPGLADGLAVVRGLLDRFWGPVHPRLDPDDGNDPTIRVNTLVALCHAEALLDGLKRAPLVAAKTAGRFSLLDVLYATGRLPAPGPKEPPAPDASVVNAAFTEIGLADLQATAAAVAQSIENVEGIESILTSQVGVSQSADFTPLTGVLRMAQKALADQLAKRGVVTSAEGVTDAGDGGAVVGAAGGAGMVLTGNIMSREDALRALDKVVEYFERHEPSSPLPLVLNRAKKLVGKGFIEIMRDLAPDGLSQVELVTKARDEQQ